MRRDTKVTESSESVLAGTKRPPFRLYCNAVVPPGANLRIRPAVSEEFVVRCPAAPCALLERMQDLQHLIVFQQHFLWSDESGLRNGFLLNVLFRIVLHCFGIEFRLS